MNKELLIRDIRKLAQEKKALILAHNYQPPEIQDIADLTGDSLELSIKASQTEAKVIVFCGVRFMAETSAILCPQKKVILPKLEAGCEMADMITVEDLRTLKEKHPQAPVVTYVNSYAEIKALSDICCTSANSIKIVGSLKASEIIMIPDRNLARYTQRFFPEKKIYYHQGYCPFHEVLVKEEVDKILDKYPQALFMAHPECRPEVIDMAAKVFSTSGMLHFARSSEHKEFIVGTEVGLLYPLQKQNPEKIFYPASPQMYCKAMKMISLEDLLISLETLEPRVEVPSPIREKAYHAVEAMLNIPK